MRYASVVLTGWLLGMGASLPAGEVLIVSGHPDYPPVTWEENGAIVGAAAELAKQVFTELKVPFEIRATGPWKRVQENARSGQIDVITSAYINAERLEYMDYTVPFMKDPNVVFVWKGKAFPFTTWDDLIGKVGTANRGESYEEKFDTFAAEKLKIERVTQTVQNLQKLEAGRVDYFLSGLYPGLAVAAIEGYDDKIEALPTPVVTADFYMTFSKKSKYTYLIPQVNKIIERCKAKGLIDKWLKDYLAYYKKTRKQATH